MPRGLLGTAVGRFLPPSRAGRVMALGGAVDSVGSGLFLAAATIYFVHTVGMSAVSVGTALAVANAVALLAPTPLGRLADRVGAHRVFVALLLVRALGYACYAFVTSYPPYLVLTCLLTAADRASAPLYQAVIGNAVDGSQRTSTMTSIRAVRNMGLAVGFLLAAAVQAVHWQPAFTLLFLVNGASFLATAFAVRSVSRSAPAPASAPVPDDGRPTASASAATSEPPYRNGRFLLLAAANTFAMLHDSILFVLLPLWVVQRAGLSPTYGSMLLVINTALTVASPLYAARFVRDLRSSVRVIRWACGLLVVVCALFMAAEAATRALALGLAVLAVIGLTLGENLVTTASWELSYETAPADRRSQYLAFFSLGITAQRTIGPVIMTAIVLPFGTPGWLLLIVLFLLAAVVTSLAARDRLPGGKPGGRPGRPVVAADPTGSA